MIEYVKQPWPWYVSGPLIGLTIPLLLILGNKSLGISSSLKHICAACIPGKIPFLNYDWKHESWNLIFAFGIIIGGYVGANFLTNPSNIDLSDATVTVLKQNNISDFSGYMPKEIFNWESLLTLKGFIIIVIGGFMVGFGTRYANGCTSGHSIMGLSNLQWPSLVATICFFIGGLFITHFVLPFILKL